MAYVKVYKYKKQVSYDQGVTWYDVIPEEYVPSGTPIAYFDTLEECEGVEPSFKFKLTLNDSSTFSAECDSTSAITESEVSTPYSSTLVSAEIGDCVASISIRAFRGCTSLTSVTIPDSVTTIGRNAFRECSSLSNITIPNSVTSIGVGAFSYCSSLTSIAMPNSVTTIGNQAFMGCTSLTSCTIPSGVTSIGDGTFGHCIGLTSINIPNSATSIGDGAFDSCYILTTIYIPSGVTSIGYGAFRNCSGLTSITVNATTPPTLGSNAFDNTNNCPIYVPCESVNTYKTASGWSTYASRIQGIPPCGQPTFNGKYKLTLSNSSTVSAECDSTSAITESEVSTPYKSTLVSAEIDDCVNTIDAYAFYECSSLTSVTIPDSVTTIGYGAFWACGLTSIDIPNSVKTIGDKAFTWCSRLTSVDIPSGVTSIGDYAFEQCYNLTSVTVNATTPPTLGVFAFRTTNSCPIYVPSGSVNAYKSATNWSGYSSRIQAIP